MSEKINSEILTTDGIPLKESLKKSERKNKIRAILLVAPLLIFIFFTFVIPIGSMLTRSTDDSYINKIFPKTFKVYQNGTDKVYHQKKFMPLCFLRLKMLLDLK